MMDFFILTLVSGFGFVAASLYFDSKFHFEPPDDDDIASVKNAAWWRKVIVTHNSAIKYGALFALWLITIIFAYLSRIEEPYSILYPNHYRLNFVLFCLSFGVYFLAHSWPLVIPED